MSVLSIGHNSRSRQTSVELAIIDFCSDVDALRRLPVARMQGIDVAEDPESIRALESLAAKAGACLEDFFKALTDIAGQGPVGSDGELSDCIGNTISATLITAADQAWGIQERDNSDRVHHSTLNHAQQGI